MKISRRGHLVAGCLFAVAVIYGISLSAQEERPARETVSPNTNNAGQSFSPQVPAAGSSRKPPVRFGPETVVKTNTSSGQPNRAKFTIESDIKTTLRRYQNSDETEVRAELVKILRGQLIEQFSMQQQYREAEILSIEAELARVRKLHENRAANQAAIVESRVKQLLTTAEGLGWEMPDDSDARPDGPPSAMHN